MSFHRCDPTCAIWAFPVPGIPGRRKGSTSWYVRGPPCIRGQLPGFTELRILGTPRGCTLAVNLKRFKGGFLGDWSIHRFMDKMLWSVSELAIAKQPQATVPRTNKNHGFVKFLSRHRFIEFIDLTCLHHRLTRAATLCQRFQGFLMHDLSFRGRLWGGALT